MKIQVTGTTQNKLEFVKWVKNITGYGLLESKELVESMLDTKKPLILNIESYRDAMDSYNQKLSNSGLTVKKHRVEIINKLLKEENFLQEDVEYEDFLELFNYLYKKDKETLRILMNNGVDDLKEKLNDLKL